MFFIHQKAAPFTARLWDGGQESDRQAALRTAAAADGGSRMSMSALHALRGWLQEGNGPFDDSYAATNNRSKRDINPARTALRIRAASVSLPLPFDPPSQITQSLGCQAPRGLTALCRKQSSKTAASFSA